MTADRALLIAADALQLSPTAGQFGALSAFADLLRDRGVELGVVSAGDRDRILERHVIDSLRANRAIEEGDRSAYDLGSGAGLPGIVVAIVRPGMEIFLVESRTRRVAWLESVVRDLELSNAQVVHERVEALTARVDVCFSRAFAPPRRAWALARGLLRPGGRLVYFAGGGLARSSLEQIAENVRILENPGLESGGPLAIIAGS